MTQLSQPGTASIKRPVAPPVYRPQPVPKVLQAKSALPGSQSLNKNSGSSVPRVNQINKAPALSGPHVQRHIRPHVTKPVVQRMEVAKAPIEILTDEVILVIMDVTAVYVGARNVINFALTSKKMYPLVMNNFRSIRGILRTYCNTVEPLLHGAHLDVERLGLPGSGTILGLALNGRFISWTNLDKKFSTETGAFKLRAWEQKVAKKVRKYSELSIVARTDRESIEQMEKLTRKEKNTLQKQSVTITEARQHSPAKTFQVFLLLNKAATSNPAEFTGKVGSWLDERSERLKTLLIEPTHDVVEYQNLSSTKEEPDSCGHSEQVMLMTKQWEDVRTSLFEYAKVIFRVPPQQWIPTRQLTLLLNRSPCTSCGRFLVAELEAFWSALGRVLGQTTVICRERLKTRITFNLGYGVEYGKTTQRSDQYPNLIILTALQKAGWVIKKLPIFTPQERKPDACLGGATLNVRPPQQFDISKIQFVEDESEKEFIPSEDEDDSDEEERLNRSRRTRHRSSSRGKGSRGGSQTKRGRK